MIAIEKKKKEYNCKYFFTDEREFQNQTEGLLSQIPHKEQVLRIVFFGETSNNRYEEELAIIRSSCMKTFGDEYPLLSYVTQPVLGKGRLAIEVHYMPATLRDVKPRYCTEAGIRYLVLETTTNKSVMTEGVRGAELQASVRIQSDDIFRKIRLLLEKEELEISDIVRQWNYIGAITAFEGSVQNYQAFNDSRSLFYQQADWSKHGYPAATGIGMGCGGVIVELIASRINPKSGAIHAIDNPLQIAAHLYSQDVLLGKEDERLSNRSTPKFERAKTIWSDAGYTCFVSGTAAIRGEESLENTNIHKQTRLTIENINHLISASNQEHYGVRIKEETEISSVRIYVKNPDDYEAVRQETELNWGTLPALYVEADVCREELLVEIEGVASIMY